MLAAAERWARGADPSLVRHFVFGALDVAAPPYSPDFAASLIRCIGLPCVLPSLVLRNVPCLLSLAHHVTQDSLAHSETASMYICNQSRGYAFHFKDRPQISVVGHSCLCNASQQQAHALPQSSVLVALWPA